MRVLQFGFDGNNDNPHLPHNFSPNTVAYTGTHDNNTTRGWFEELPGGQKQAVWKYMGRPSAGGETIATALLETAWASRATLAIAPLQDVLNLGAEARMNVPGRPDGNWSWRATEGMLSKPRFDRLREITNASGRFGPASVKPSERILSTVS